MGEEKKWYLGELIAASVFVAASLIAWLGWPVFWAGDGRFSFLFGGVIVSALSFSLLVALEGTHRLVRRIAIVSAFGSAIPILFSPSFLLGAGAALVASAVAEVGAIRVSHLTEAFRRSNVVSLASASSPFFFSALSIIFAAALLLSPPLEGKTAIPFSEKAIRSFLRWSDPIVAPIIGFSLRGSIDEVIAHATGISDPRAIVHIREDFSKRLGIPLSGKEDIPFLLAKTAQREFVRLQEQLGAAYDFGFLVSAFILFRFLAVPFRWLTMVFIVPMVWILRAAALITEIEEPVVRIVLSWR
jgi:hypothetical protein